MATSAKVLGTGDVRRLIAHTRRTRHAIRNQVIVLLSFKAGLRAGEIAGLDWTMVLRPDGQAGLHIQLARQITKCKRGRRIPLNPELRSTLVKLHRLEGCPTHGAIIKSERGGHMTAKGVVNWFLKAYAHLRMEGCSSHSGRRTFITLSARLLPRVGGSLRDVQILVGHSDLATTQRYIDGDSDVQRKLLRLL